MTELFLSRAQLRQDAPVRALAALLLPEGESARAVALHRLVWSLMSDGPDRRRDFLWREYHAPAGPRREAGELAFLMLGPRPATDRLGLFDVEHKPWDLAARAGDHFGFALR